MSIRRSVSIVMYCASMIMSAAICAAGRPWLLSGVNIGLTPPSAIVSADAAVAWRESNGALNRDNSGTNGGAFLNKGSQPACFQQVTSPFSLGTERGGFEPPVRQ